MPSSSRAAASALAIEASRATPASASSCPGATAEVVSTPSVTVLTG